MATTDATREAFVGRLFDASLGTMDVLSIYLGDRLGLYRALAEHGALTASGLADAAGIDGRYAREWLEQQAVTGIIETDADAPAQDRRFSLPAAHVEPLTDPESPYSMAPLCRSVAALGIALPSILDAFRSGEGVPWESYGDDMIEAQGDFNRPWLTRSFATEYLPSIPDVDERLRSGARVADVACGVGWAAIAIAIAYPQATVDGFDVHEGSIRRATEHAAQAGVADRVTFEARDASEPALADRYDLAVVIEAIHDLSRPVEVLASIRSMLRTDGTLIVADERVGDTFTAPSDDAERLFYGYSILTCLPSGMLEKPSAATGTVMRRETFQGYANDAGFTGFAELPIDHDFLRFYRLDP